MTKRWGLLIVTAGLALGGCSSHPAPANETANQSSASIVTPIPALETPHKVGFACTGDELDHGETKPETITTHFVLDDGLLYELSNQTGKPEDVCNGQPCKTTVTEQQIGVFQNYTDKATPETPIQNRITIIINRLTGHIHQDYKSTFTGENNKLDGWGFEYNAECTKEAPQETMKPRF